MTKKTMVEDQKESEGGDAWWPRWLWWPGIEEESDGGGKDGDDGGGGDGGGDGGDLNDGAAVDAGDWSPHAGGRLKKID